MAKTTIDMTGFSRGMAGFVDKLGLSSQVVLKKEMSELVKTLVKFTPAATVENIKAGIAGKFEAAGDSKNSDVGQLNGSGSIGKSGIVWYEVSSKYLRGVAPEKDMRDASVDQLKKLLYSMTKSGALRLPIKGHPSQRAIILQTILVKKSTLKKLIAAKAKNRGRLKAGWLSAVFDGKLDLSGSNKPPRWVMDHKQGVAGRYEDGSKVKNFPTFTVVNTAAGVGNPENKLNGVVQFSLDLRSKAMTTNLGMFMRGKKYLSDYA